MIHGKGEYAQENMGRGLAWSKTDTVVICIHCRVVNVGYFAKQTVIADVDLRVKRPETHLEGAITRSSRLFLAFFKIEDQNRTTPSPQREQLSSPGPETWPLQWPVMHQDGKLHFLYLHLDSRALGLLWR
jgi:hypothetical protein